MTSTELCDHLADYTIGCAYMASSNIALAAQCLLRSACIATIIMYPYSCVLVEYSIADRYCLHAAYS
eukprot:20501-Heterococcus_DN1.PRE.5